MRWNGITGGASHISSGAADDKLHHPFVLACGHGLIPLEGHREQSLVPPLFPLDNLFHRELVSVESSTSRRPDKSQARQVAGSTSRRLDKSQARQAASSTSRKLDKSQAREAASSTSRKLDKPQARQAASSTSRKLDKSQARQIVDSTSRRLDVLTARSSTVQQITYINQLDAAFSSIFPPT